MKNNGDEYLREQMQQQEQGCSVIAVASGKGGVGKTSISSNLAICLAAKGKKVVLFDADMGLANLDIMLNLQSRYNISHILDGQRSIEDVLTEGPMGIEVLCGANGIGDIADLSDFQRERLISELEKLQKNSDIIIIDNSAGIQKSVVGFCLAADSVMVVTTPEPTAITDAYSMIKVLKLKNFQGRINLIVNMATSVAEAKQVYRQISTVASRFLDAQVYDAGVVLKDELFSAAVKSRKPIVISNPRSKAALSLINMAGRLTRKFGDNRRQQSFFRKVVSRFF